MSGDARCTESADCAELRGDGVDFSSPVLCIAPIDLLQVCAPETAGPGVGLEGATTMRGLESECMRVAAVEFMKLLDLRLAGTGTGLDGSISCVVTGTAGAEST